MSGTAIDKAIEEGDWSRALTWASSEEQLPTMARIWPLVEDIDEAARLFAVAYSGGDNPARARSFVLAALDELRAADVRVLDDDEGPDVLGRADAAFAKLPEVVRVYRGGVEAERDGLGTSWSLDAEVARMFATSHGRFRNSASPACLFSATVDRADVRVLLYGRSEAELVVDPRHLRDVTVEPIAAAEVKPVRYGIVDIDREEPK